MKSHFLLSVFLISSNFLIAQFATENVIAISITDVKEMAHGDLDGDGDEDIAFVGNTSDMVAWIENLDGEGKMSLPIILDETFYQGDAIRIADLNGDGNLDIIAISRGETATSQIAWYPNEGAGTFGEKEIIHQQASISSSGQWQLEIMDVDADNDLDLMVGQEDDPALLMWIENFDGLGNFLPPTTIFEIDNPNYRLKDMTLADMDNDDDLDVVISRRFIATDSLFWYENNNGSFAESHFFYAISNQLVTEIKVLDADGDEDMDVVMLANFSSDFKLFENLGGGNMSAPIIIDNSAGFSPVTFCVADIDADEDLDLVYYGSDSSSDSVSVFIMENLNDDFFGNPQMFPSLLKSGSSGTIYGVDLNGDGADEILPVAETEGKIVIHGNDGFGNLSAAKLLTGKLLHHGVVTLADFDNNGFADIIGQIFQYDLFWYKNEDNQCFSPQHITNEAPYFSKSAAIDLNVDGAMDLVTVSTDAPTESLVGFLNDGTGNFLTTVELAAVAVDNGITNFFFEDLDNDGDNDLIFGDYMNTYWKENTDGFGTFGSAVLLTDTRMEEYQWNDFDGDGDNDFCTNQFPDKSLYLVENSDGNGNFLPAESIINEDSYIHSFAEGDFDLDGDLDLAVVFSETNDIIIYYNNNQDFSESVEVYNGSSLISLGRILAFDVDYDGLTDLVYDFGNDLVWQKNLGNGVFSARITIAENSFFSGITFFDMDNDGDEDLVAAGLKRKSWFENVALNPTISASHFFDNNENGQQESDDFLLLNNSVLLNPNGLYTFPNNDGIHQFAVNNGSYTLSTNEPINWTLTTDSLSFDIQVADTSVEKSFGWKPLIEETAIEANLTSGPPRCDQEVPFWLGYTNTGTTINDALIQLEIDDLVNFISAIPAPDSVQNNVYYWNVTEVLPTHSGNIELVLMMPNANSTGEITAFPYQVNALDENSNSIFQQNDTLFNEIQCAYDPNDKMVFPDRGEPLHPIGLDERLEYTIRFQNTGNDTAYHVFIKDQLDENLDWTTLIPLQSSHPMDMTLDENGLVTFRFLNIYLPDSLSNPVGSQGFVKYQIDLQSGLTEGLVIENTAQIIFDSNPAIITNTTQNTLSSEITNVNSVGANDLIVEYSPNPFSDFITLKINGQTPLL